MMKKWREFNILFLLGISLAWGGCGGRLEKIKLYKGKDKPDSEIVHLKFFYPGGYWKDLTLDGTSLYQSYSSWVDLLLLPGEHIIEAPLTYGTYEYKPYIKWSNDEQIEPGKSQKLSFTTFAGRQYSLDYSGHILLYDDGKEKTHIYPVWIFSVLDKTRGKKVGRSNVKSYENSKNEFIQTSPQLETGLIKLEQALLIFVVDGQMQNGEKVKLFFQDGLGNFDGNSHIILPVGNYQLKLGTKEWYMNFAANYVKKSTNIVFAPKEIKVEANHRYKISSKRIKGTDEIYSVTVTDITDN